MSGFSRRVALLTAAVVAVSGTACASVPTSGQVVEVSAEPDSRAGVEIAPAPPPKDVSPEHLVAGFLQSMAVYEAAPAVARAFLTPAAAESWRPEAGIQVYQAGAPVTGADSAELDVSLTGKVSDSGRFTRANGRLRHDFGIEKVDGQWRIGNPPDGLLISDYLFFRYFLPYSVYFLNPAQEKVVPDPVFLPVSATPDRLLSALFAGPSSELAAAVVTGFPDGVELSAPVEVSDDGVATISLNRSMTGLDEAARRVVGAQLWWTMTSFPAVKSLYVTMEGAQFAIPGQSRAGTLDSSTQQGFQVLSGPQDASLFAVHDQRLGRLDDKGTFQPAPGALGAANAGVGQVGLSQDGSGVAAVDTTRTRLMLGSVDGPVAALAPGMTDLAHPQMVFGQAWAQGVRPDGSSALVVMDSNDKATFYSLPADLEGSVIRAFSVAPGGARVALSLSRGGESMLGVAVIPAAGQRLTSWRAMNVDFSGVGLSDFLDVGWSDQTTVVALAKGQNAAGTYSLTIDAYRVAEWLGPSGPVAVDRLSVQPRATGLALLVSGAEGAALRYEGRSGWVSLPGEFDQVTLAG